MNIKGLVSNIIPVDFLKKERHVTRQTTDRDPSQGGAGQQPPEQHRFTDAELEEALKMLGELQGIKENNLQFRVERNDARIVVFVEDVSGKVIRRIPDTELWHLLTHRQKDSKRGNLLNKSM
ncbi:MAG: flagellar protein FlaG [Oligoflexia bacterium]|nr:flagellar protein FlaG [Oligoflexia bacterium]